MFSILLLLYLYYVWKIVNYLRYSLEIDLNKFKYRDPNIDELYKPYERRDFAKWNKFEIYFCAIFLLPVKLIILSISCIIYYIFLRIVHLGVKDN